MDTESISGYQATCSSSDPAMQTADEDEGQEAMDVRIQDCETVVMPDNHPKALLIAHAGTPD